MSTYNLCFEQKYEKYQNFSSENLHSLVVKFSIYLNRRVFVMQPIESKSHMGIGRLCYYCKTLRKHAYSNILTISPPKTESFQIKILIFFIFLLKTYIVGTR